MSEANSKALEGVQVIEIAGPGSAYVGRLFAGMGAEVILVEPPEGAAQRRQGPFEGDVPGVERSLVHNYFNAGKRGVTLDLDSVDGQEIFKKLIKNATVLLESEPAGLMKKRGLDYESLKKINPALVHTSITSYGSEGPYAEYPAVDLNLLAMGGLLALGGYPEAEPTRPYGDQAILAGSQFAAIGTMLAVYDAEASGQGQFVDVSTQEAVTMTLQHAIQYWDYEKVERTRKNQAGAGSAGSGTYRCKDGEINVGAFRRWDALVQWMEESGVARAEDLTEERWKDREFLATPEAKRIFGEIFSEFAMAHTKRELYEGGMERSISLVPINSPADVLASEQLEFRHFWEKLPDSSRSRDLVMPGGPFQFSKTPWKIERPAPSLGGHNAEVLGELGLTGRELQHLAEGGVI
ncbi:MAG: CoA transferase [Chloroflexi bacterium]|nr:CoA transferase [Chloroflexota bacterium]